MPIPVGQMIRTTPGSRAGAWRVGTVRENYKSGTEVLVEGQYGAHFRAEVQHCQLVTEYLLPLNEVHGRDSVQIGPSGTWLAQYVEFDGDTATLTHETGTWHGSAVTWVRVWRQDPGPGAAADALRQAVREVPSLPDLALAVNRLALALGTGEVGEELGGRMTCSEAEAVADVMRAGGYAAEAEAWTGGHVEEECGTAEEHRRQVLITRG